MTILGSLCFIPASPTVVAHSSNGTLSMKEQTRLLTKAHQMGLSNVYLPTTKNGYAAIQTYDGESNQVLRIEEDTVVLFEATHPILLEDADAVEELGQVGVSSQTNWITFALPRQPLRHVLSLHLPHAYVLVSPKKSPDQWDRNQIVEFSKSLKVFPSSRTV